LASNTLVFVSFQKIAMIKGTVAAEASTVLLFLSAEGGIKVFDSLLKCGAEVDDKDNKSMTSLMPKSYQGALTLPKPW